MGTLTNSEDPDEMQHDAAFHQGLHCKGKKIFRLSSSSCTRDWIVTFSGLILSDHGPAIVLQVLKVYLRQWSSLSGKIKTYSLTGNAWV